VVDIMWVVDYFAEATLKMKEEEAERLRLLAELPRRARQGGNARAWRWRIEPGMGEAFRDLLGWFLPSEQEAAVKTATLAQGALRLQEVASVGRPDKSLLPVGWPVPLCCPLTKGRRDRDADLAVAGPVVPCCAP
jgi:hypothetical protein